MTTVRTDYVPFFLGETITTTRGPMYECHLAKTEGVIDNENEYTTWVEYRIKDEVVHRSAHVSLKTSVFAESNAGSF
jgi:hypothetical protein